LSHSSVLTQLSGNKGLLWSRVSEKSDVFVIMKSPTDAGHVTGTPSRRVILAGGSAGSQDRPQLDVQQGSAERVICVYAEALAEAVLCTLKRAAWGESRAWC
jgi:hypothetical protein